MEKFPLGSIITCCSIGMLVLGLLMAVMFVLPFLSAFLDTSLLLTQIFGAILLLALSGLIGKSILIFLGF